VERDAVRHQAQLLGEDQQVQGHVRVAAELARQRPVGAVGTFGEDTHINLCPRRRLGNVAQVGFRVGGEQAHALLIEVANIAGLLDGIAIADALGSYASAHHLVQLVDGGDVEVAALVAQQLGDLDGRIGLDRVIDLGKREAADQLIIGIGDGLLVDDHERGFLLVGKRLHFLEGVAGVVVFDLDRHGRLQVDKQKVYRGDTERLIRFPTLVRLLPKACRRKQKGQPGGSPTCRLTLLSRRQYLSRMDRFQHGRSARTLRPCPGEINQKMPLICSLLSPCWLTVPDSKQNALECFTSQAPRGLHRLRGVPPFAAIIAAFFDNTTTASTGFPA